jgi:hypothetical protein
MQLARSQKFLTFTVPAVFGIALVVACTDNSITAPQKFQLPTALTVRSVTDDTDDLCPGSGVLTATNGGTAEKDLDGDGFVCVTTERRPPKKKG